MRILTVPNWSFGRERTLFRQFGDHFPSEGLTLHYLEADIDHNRTVTAFSGEAEPVAEEAIARIGAVRYLGRLPRLDPLTAETLAQAFAAHIDTGAFA